MKTTPVIGRSQATTAC